MFQIHHVTGWSNDRKLEERIIIAMTIIIIIYSLCLVFRDILGFAT